MSDTFAREYVDQLIDHFWLNGYLTLSRRYGTYLPEPNPIGSYNVDAVGRYNKRFAIGIVLTDEELNNEKISSKLTYLATRQTKYSNKKVTLFVGVYRDNYTRAKNLVNNLNENASKNIKLVMLGEKTVQTPLTGRKRFDKKFDLNKAA